MSALSLNTLLASTGTLLLWSWGTGLNLSSPKAQIRLKSQVIGVNVKTESQCHFLILSSHQMCDLSLTFSPIHIMYHVFTYLPGGGAIACRENRQIKVCFINYNYVIMLSWVQD